MRIMSATIRNYRVHRELSVTFDKSLTLIGGPNESGKSTLVEAIHRALFMKAKGTSEDHRAARSEPFTGHPEVEVTFEAGGTTYHLFKRFAGVNGTTSLSAQSGVPLRDAEAEATLARILGVDPATGSAMHAQWAHVWVEQGKSGVDPSADASAQRDRLLQRLQQLGAAAVLQSPFDAQVADRFSERCDGIFTNQGVPRAGSDLSKVMSAADEAERKRSEADQRVHVLHETAERLLADLEDVQALQESRERLKAEDQEITARERRLNELRQLESRESTAAEATAQVLANALAADDETVSAVELVRTLEESIAPSVQEIARLQRERTVALEGLLASEAIDASAKATARDARRHRDLAVAFVERFEKTETLVRLKAHAAEAEGFRVSLRALETQLSELPSVDKRAQKKLQSAWEDVLTARASLDAMATSLEVLEADVEVRIGDEPLDVGATRVLTDGVEVMVGAGVRLVVQPGGGTSLAEARKAATDAQASLDELLDECGIADMAAATQAFQRRSEIDDAIKKLESKLELLDAGELAEELPQAERDAHAAEAEVATRLAAIGTVEAPIDLAAAKAMVRDAKRAVKEAESAEATAEETRETSIATLRACDEALVEAQAAVDEQQKALLAETTRRDDLLQKHGDASTREKARLAAATACEASQAQLVATQSAIDALDPDSLDADGRRLERALEANAEQLQTLQVAIGQARQKLRVDGTVDPSADLAAAEARARSAAEERDRVRRQAQAVKLLDDLFTEEQRELGRQLTQPLVDRINEYLRKVFGQGITVSIEYDGARFVGLSLRRAAAGLSPFGFDVLSGGAREQAACAVRLATAELLAADHDRCLPVVLDDAFAYSDSKRVKGVHQMLDLAAARGLQIIVLSCNPADYEALGATAVRLAVAEPARVQAPMASSEFLSDSGAQFSEGEDDEEDADQASAPASSLTSAISFGASPRTEAFLSALRSQGGRCGNISLRRELGWTEEEYASVKADLVAAGRIVLGQGRGGTVALASLS